MNNSSAQESYSITLNDDQLSALTTTDTITLTGSSYTTYDPSACHTITLNTSPSFTTVYSGGTSSSGATYTIGTGISSIDISSLQINLPIEWVTCFPDWARIEKMCEEYPALKIAFEKFKTTYKLVQDDYDMPPNKRIKP